MELLQGTSLDAVLKKTPRLPVDEALRIGIELCDALSAAHHAGLIHRDVKPANIWLEHRAAEPRRGGRVKLLDFGLARSVHAETQITSSGMIVGTPAYMAPEQAAAAAEQIAAIRERLRVAGPEPTRPDRDRLAKPRRRAILLATRLSVRQESLDDLAR